MSSFFAIGQKQDTKAIGWETEADTLAAREEFEGAVVLYSKILAKRTLKEDADYEILYKRAYAYLGAGKPEEALVDINQYLQKVEDERGKLLRLYIYQALQDFAAMLEDLDTIVASNPGDPKLARWRASILMEVGEYTLAKQAIRQLLVYGPDAELQMYLGLAYYYESQPDSAFLIFDQVIAEEPSFLQTYLFAGSICLEEEAYEPASRYIGLGLKQDPANSTLLFYQGLLLVQTGKLDAGCRCLTKAFNAGFDDAGDYLKEYCYTIAE